MEKVDPITPSQIEHSVDEVWDGERLEERYNYLDYHFEEPGAYVRARVYFDDAQTATLFGPFEKRGSIARVTSHSMLDAALVYLQRRYPNVQRR